MTVLRVFLVVCVLVVVGASADASASSSASRTWTLTVTFTGTGTGTVTTSPAGIVCTNVDPSNSPQGTCSAQFPVDITNVWVDAFPDAGSRLGSFTGCMVQEKVPSACELFRDPTSAPVQPVQVAFDQSIPCIVNRVVDQPLAMAKRDLREHGCNVGTVRHVYSSADINFGEVISQNPKAHWQRVHGAVDLLVSKGRRGP